MKNSSYLGNGYDVQADVFVPFYQMSWNGSVEGRGMGIEIPEAGSYKIIIRAPEQMNEKTE
jgi:hypothetical protein